MSNDKNAVQMIEVPEDKAAPEIRAKEIPTRDELREKGWTKAEMDAAEKRGMIAKPEDGKAKEGEAAKKTEEEAKTKTETTKEPEKKTESSLPDFTFKTPEQEKAFLDAFGQGTPQRGIYFRMKNERLARQRAEQERDKLALELQLRKDRDIRIDEPAAEVDADGNPIDPEEKPLTMKQLRAMQKTESEAIARQREELAQRTEKASEALKEQEEYAKATIPDFEETVKLATDLINNLSNVTDPLKISKIKKLVKDLQVAAASADNYGVDDYTASMIAYEMGQLHPEYGKKKPETNGDKKDPKANGSLTPEQMKRIEENTQRRASSASLPGSPGGSRAVSLEDITIKDILKMSPEQRYKFKKDHPDKMAKLMRG